MYSLYFNLDNDSNFDGDFEDVYEAIRTGYRFKADIDYCNSSFDILDENDTLVFDSTKPYVNPEINLNYEGW